MQKEDAPTATDVLRSLRLLRSDEAAERQRAIKVLNCLADDPRVIQVFEHLYRNDPDPGVREAAWRAIRQQGPSIPAPGPESVPQPPDDTPAIPASPPAPAAESPPAAPARPKPRSQALFLINPANARFVANEARRQAQQTRGGRAIWWVVGILLLVVGILWGITLPDWITWYQLRESGLTIDGAITGLQVRGGDRYYAIYRFTVADGMTYTDEQRITEDAYNRLSPETPVLVTYLPDDPDVSRLDEDDPGLAVRDWVTILAAILTGALVILLIIGMVRRRPAERSKRLIRGQVVSCRGHLDADGDFHVKLRYRFLAPPGHVIAGQATRIRNDLKEAALPDTGAPVAVYFRGGKSHRLL